MGGGGGGMEQKQKKKFPRKLLIKKYIPTDSGQKKIYVQGGKKHFHPTCTKKILHLLKSPSLF